MQRPAAAPARNPGLGRDTDLWAELVWVVDSTPVECGRSRPTTQRSDLAGWAGYGYCRSHSRWFWGLRLHLVCTPAGLPVTWALAPRRSTNGRCCWLFSITILTCSSTGPGC
ncbi:hypothetical protein GCM10018965_042150 [Nonomuraea roseola]